MLRTNKVLYYYYSYFEFKNQVDKQKIKKYMHTF